MKIRIIGGCGSGKTFIAKQLSKQYGIPHFQTDNLVWNRTNNKKYPEETRDRMLNEILERDSWILEGVHHKWGQKSFTQANFIFIINPTTYIQNWRVIKRFIKTRFNLEERNYTQDLKNLKVMIAWNRKYKRIDIKRILELTAEHKNKRYIVKDNKEILKILD